MWRLWSVKIVECEDWRLWSEKIVECEDCGDCGVRRLWSVKIMEMLGLWRLCRLGFLSYK